MSRFGWQRRRYALWAPIYDAFVVPFRKARRRSVDGLALRPGERVLLVGAGTGEDLPLLPPGTFALATDLTVEMLRRARHKGRAGHHIVVMDGQMLALGSGTFDAVVLHLILAVIPDPARCLAEAVRVLRPGGRIAILDKFVPDGQAASLGRRLLNGVTRPLATDITRRLEDILRDSGVRVHAVQRDEVLGGLFTIARLVTPGG